MFTNLKQVNLKQVDTLNEAIAAYKRLHAAVGNGTEVNCIFFIPTKIGFAGNEEILSDSRNISHLCDTDQKRELYTQYIKAVSEYLLTLVI